MDASSTIARLYGAGSRSHDICARRVVTGPAEVEAEVVVAVTFPLPGAAMESRVEAACGLNSAEEEWAPLSCVAALSVW